MENLQNITGIVLSGGQSKRMGREKGLIPLLGKPLIAYSIHVLEKTCSEVIISANQEDYKAFGFPVINDEMAGIGPAGGILSCLKASRTEGNFILSCDMPLVSTDLVRYILERRGNAGVTVPLHNGYPEPLCGFYSKAIIPEFRNRIKNGVYKIQDILEKLNVSFLEIEPALGFYHPGLFENVNTQYDLKRIEAILKSKRP